MKNAIGFRMGFDFMYNVQYLPLDSGRL